ncbi:MAG TPA: hypothetical protein VMT16_16875 [Thermoanaerobaculia bacterium]|nr:hypothetical protein [Thermoanaerobaculia bacterium]
MLRILLLLVLLLVLGRALLELGRNLRAGYQGTRRETPGPAAQSLSLVRCGSCGVHVPADRVVARPGEEARCARCAAG